MCDWVEEHIAETWSYYRLPVAHHKHLKSTNLLKRYHQEIQRRTLVLKIFPNAQNCLRLIRTCGGNPRELD